MEAVLAVFAIVLVASLAVIMVKAGRAEPFADKIDR
jgi:hypothetical protein